jgi:hypothetical protein
MKNPLPSLWKRKAYKLKLVLTAFGGTGVSPVFAAWGALCPNVGKVRPTIPGGAGILQCGAQT